MTVREACNYAYFHIVKDMREEDRAARMVGHKFPDSLEERIELFEEKIGLRPNHEDLALWMHKNVLLPALGREHLLEEDEKVGTQLPPGVDEADRWRFEDHEWDGLADFQGSPWDLPGMEKIRKETSEISRERMAQEAKETL